MIAAIVFLIPGSIPWSRTYRAPVRVLPSGHRDQASAAITMTAGTAVPHATAVLLDDDQGILRSATCPMCHTSATLSQSALETGGAWRCVRCGQLWDAARLAAVAAYAAWSIDHHRVRRRGAEGSHDVPLYGHLPTGRLGGRS